MQIRFSSLLPLALVVACSSASNTKPVTSSPKPVAQAGPAKKVLTQLQPTRRDDTAEELFGVSVLDPYRWLEDEKAEEVRAWMKDRDAHARAALASVPGRADLVKRYRELLYVKKQSAPIVRGGRLFFSVTPPDKEKAIHYWQDEGGAPQVLLDPNTMSDDGSVSIGSVIPSHDGKRVGYMLKSNNADESTLVVMDVDTKKIHEADKIEHLRYTAPSWTPDNAGFFYTWIPSDPSIPTNERMGYGEIRYHKLGTSPAKDKIYRGKTGDPSRWQSAWVSKDGKYLFLTISRGWAEQDVYVQFLKDKKAAWKPLAVGTKALYSIDAHKGTFYVASNHEAPKWRLFKVQPKKLARKYWKEIVAEDKEAVLDDFDIVGGKLAIKYLKNATTQLQLHELSGKMFKALPMPALGSASSLVGNADRDEAYFSFQSFNTPNEVYKTSVKTAETKLHFRPEVPMTPEDYVVEQVFYPSKDGTKISMFLVRKKDVPKKDRPLFMFGYGGFNISLTPRWDPLIIPWLEKGGIYAMPNLRGGGEYGESWHQAGMLGNKQNVFDDYIGAAEWLIKEGITTKEKLGIRGRSNGGLLVGAAMTQRPELYSAVVCGVPLLDMVRYHKFGVGRAWIPEYGTAENEADFKWLHAYSPYHRVKKGTEYPALLMLSADTDDRVDPLHARKFVAQIEHASTSKEPVLLRIEANSGHGGADMRGKYAERAADMIAFFMSELM